MASAPLLQKNTLLQVGYMTFEIWNGYNIFTWFYQVSNKNNIILHDVERHYLNGSNRSIRSS